MFFLWKAFAGVALNNFPIVLLLLNICQCLLIIYVIFGKVGPNVPKMELCFFRIVLALFNRVDLSKEDTESLEYIFRNYIILTLSYFFWKHFLQK